MTHWRTFYHLIWATYDRMPWITPEVEAILFPAIRTKAHELGMFVYALDGVADHIHMVVAIPPRLAVAAVVGEIKGRSSFVVRHRLDLDFKWQRGFGVLTFGKRHLPVVIDYVQHQKERHAQQTLHPRLEITTEEDDGPPPVTPDEGH